MSKWLIALRYFLRFTICFNLLVLGIFLFGETLGWVTIPEWIAIPIDNLYFTTLVMPVFFNMLLFLEESLQQIQKDVVWAAVVAYVMWTLTWALGIKIGTGL